MWAASLGRIRHTLACRGRMCHSNLSGYQQAVKRDTEFTDAMGSVAPGIHLTKVPIKSIVVGVSGGPDSVALAHLAHQWAAEQGCEMRAVTVDHRLRPESESEAKGAQQQLARREIDRMSNWPVYFSNYHTYHPDTSDHSLYWSTIFSHCTGIQHDIIPIDWGDAVPTTRVSEECRKMRYKLLTDYCKEKNATIILTAHHMDDRVEGLLLNMAHLSGLYGLSSLHARLYIDQNLFLVRPLLSFSKQRLIDTCEKEQYTFVNDPSNSYTHSDRIRRGIRGLDVEPQQLYEIVELMANTRRYYEEYVTALKRTIRVSWGTGHLSFCANQFGISPVESQVRFILEILNFHHPHSSISLRAVKKLAHSLQSLGKGSTAKFSHSSSCFYADEDVPNRIFVYEVPPQKQQEIEIQIDHETKLPINLGSWQVAAPRKRLSESRPCTVRTASASTQRKLFRRKGLMKTDPPKHLNAQPFLYSNRSGRWHTSKNTPTYLPQMTYRPNHVKLTRLLVTDLEL